MARMTITTNATPVITTIRRTLEFSAAEDVLFITRLLSEDSTGACQQGVLLGCPASSDGTAT
jgi:hypothetical protein